MIDAQDIKVFGDAVKQAKTMFITAHVGPDGDTLGSMLGIRHALLANFDHIETIDCVITGSMPYVYRFMPGIDLVKDVEGDAQFLETYDLAFSVDCGSAERLGPAKTHFLNATQSINIDHHISNDGFGTHNVIDAEACASGEVVFDLLEGNNFTIPADAATALYVAILTDTGGFKYSCTNAKTFAIMAKLTECGASPENIYRYIYEECEKKQMLLHAKAITQAHFNEDNTLSWTVVPRSLMSEFGADDEHVEGLVEELRRIETVLVSAMLRETKDGNTKISLRSDTQAINVADIVKHWNGGGHKMAAGATIPLPPPEAEKELIPILKDVLQTHKSAG